MNVHGANGVNARTFEYLSGVMHTYTGDTVGRGIINYAFRRTAVSDDLLEREGIPEQLIRRLQRGVEIFIDDLVRRQQCHALLTSLVGKKISGPAAAPDSAAGHADAIPLRQEEDIVAARNRARRLAETQGFSRTEQIKIATAVSELARNVVRYAGAGSLALQPLAAPRPGLRVVCEDAGPGIADLEAIYRGDYRSKTGLGLGILGVRRIMDEFDLQTGPTGTRVTAAKYRE